MRKYARLTEEEKAYIREHLPQSTYAQVARELGRQSTTVIWFARRNGIEHSKAAVRLACGAHLRNESSRDRAARFKKIAETRKEMYRKERRRVKWGLERRTKINACATAPNKVIVARHHLKSQRSYVLEDCRAFNGNPYNVYYDSETMRSPNEAYYTEKYGFKFIPLD